MERAASAVLDLCDSAMTPAFCLSDLSELGGVSDVPRSFGGGGGGVCM